MKKLIALIILISSFANAQFYEVLLETKYHPEYTPEYLEKMFKDMKDPEVRKWHIDQYTNAKPIEFKIYSSKTELNTIEQEKIDNQQGTQGEIKNSAPGLPFGLTYSNFTNGENYRQVDVYGKNYIVITPLEELDWKYTDETKEILGYKAYKATSKYGYFNVEAWFTKEIDFNFMPITVKPIEGFVLEMNIFLEAENVGKLNNYIKVLTINKNVKKYKFKNPIKEPGKKDNVVTPQELDKIYEEANNKRNAMYNQEGVDKK
ncbi:GLPGLI family protein [Empedobacter falsenii]|uniref:GLPGLI family protein n=1 Tax=Empedobacter falsenii TaxID=343874 RepID=UPI002578FB45|nr:GLPGLI family protein [Empedobacter falsenii]MDM1297887.1 GLPGLI family protein [Empedobacter falsenii]MDM1317485.1 GLPGLI family protein [Empedobacter falsenii]